MNRIYVRKEPPTAMRRMVGFGFCAIAVMALTLLHEKWYPLTGVHLFDLFAWLVFILSLGFMFTVGSIIMLSKKV